MNEVYFGFWGLPAPVIVLLVVWTIIWKGIALWKAARLGQRNWFIILLVVNTLAILEIIYIFFVAKGKCCDVVKAENKLPTAQ